MVLFPQISDGAILSNLLKKACIILLHEIKLPIKPLASLKSLQPPYNHVALQPHIRLI